MKPKSLLLFLLVIGVGSLDGKCPKKCNCSMKKGKNKGERKLKVDCRGEGLTKVYSSGEFPSDMRYLYLSNNNITVIEKHFLADHSQLERLYLQKNSIRVLEGRAFIGLHGLQRLLLKQNKLVKINPNAFLGLVNLDVLDLSSNRIKSIDKFGFVGLGKLTKLVLNSNNFKTIENGTFNSLKMLKKIYLHNVPLTCDCRLNPFVQFINEPPKKRILGSCSGTPPTSLSVLMGTNLCEPPPQLSIFPKTNQVVAMGDSIRLVCNATYKPSLSLSWTKNKQRLANSKTILVSKSEAKNQRFAEVRIAKLTAFNDGKYSCVSSIKGMQTRSVDINVVSSTSRMCARDLFKTSRGNLVWPVTLAGTTKAISCPLLANDDDTRASDISRTCTQDGEWGVVNFGKCRWIPLTQKLTELKKILEQEDFKDIARILTTLKVLSSEPSNFQSSKDISLVLSIVDRVNRKQGSEPFDAKVMDNILAIFSNLIDVDKGIIYEAERRDQSPSRLAAHLELITRRNVNQRLSRVFPNIVIHSIRLQKKGFKGKTCFVFLSSEPTSLPQGVLCQPERRKNFLVSIHIPKTIFQNLTVDKNDEILEVQFLIYRSAKLLPNVVSNKTSKLLIERNISSSVLAIQLSSIKEVNLTEPLVITFNTKVGSHPLISHFDFREKDVGKTWLPNSDCHVNRSTSTTTTVDCVKLVNKNLAVMSLLGSESIVEYSVEIVVYFGAVTASLCLLVMLVTFATFRNLRFDRDDVAMLMNVCLSLMIVLITFAFGIDRTDNHSVCHVVGIFLHYFFLASLLWLGSYIVCVSRSLNPPKESEEVFNPVLRYYLVSWGVPAIICGITLAGDVKNYKTSDYCWLTESAGLGAFVGPACLLFIINSVLLVRLHLLLAHGPVSDQGHGDENSEEERLQADEPVGELELTPLPQALAEKSKMTLNLVATWVVMSLIYVNFIVAYLLVKSRHVTFSWKLVSYVYALVNIALGTAMLLFHCVVRDNVRETWWKAWKTVHAKRINFSRWRTRLITWKRRGKQEHIHANGLVLLNGEDTNLSGGKSGESDRQSNITLPSSAALTNDVFLNGRPLSTARVSLLDDADFPPDENSGRGAEVNEVDITEVGSDDGHPRSHTSVHSGRGSAAPSAVASVSKTIPEDMAEQETPSIRGNLFPSETQEENPTDITDGVTSRSESSAPTAIEVPLPTTSTPSESSVRERPKKLLKSQQSVETPASPSSSSLSEAPVKGQNSKRRKSSESLNSRHESGSVGPRARRLQHLQPTYALSGSSTHSEIAPKVPDPKSKHSNESVNTHGTPRNAVSTSNGTQRPINRYRDGREKPAPKQWTGNLGPRIAYVAVPHVSKIHREPTHDETSV